MLLFLLKKYVSVVNVLLIAAIAYLVAAMVNDALRDRIESGASTAISVDAFKDKYENVRVSRRPRSHYDAIVKTNLFGPAAGDELDTSDVSAPAFSGFLSEGDVPKTSLSLELLGTFLRSASFPSPGDVAVIKNVNNGKVKGYSRGQWIDLVEGERVEMGRIGNCEAIILRDGAAESVACGGLASAGFPKDGATVSARKKGSSRSSPRFGDRGVKKVGDGLYRIEKKMFDEFLDQPNSIIGGARIVPKSDGIKVLGVKTRSVFYKIGIRNGDTIHRINDVTLDDVQNALSLFSDLKYQDEFTIDYTRRGKKRSNRYSVH